MRALNGRVAIITGAGQGIGHEHALLFAKEGAKVIVNDPGVAMDGSGGDVRIAQQVADEITAAGGDAVANTDSVADWGSAQGMVRQAIDTFGDLHIVVNNAGILRNELLVHMTQQQFDQVIDVHLKGTFNLMRWAAAYWREAFVMGKPVDRAMINTSSGSGLHNPLPTEGNYAAAKAGIAALTMVGAIELRPFQVRVNCISPSRARTRATADVPGIAGPSQDEQFDPFHPGNISPLAAYLATSTCPFTGQVFSVYGGVVTRYQGWSLAEEVRSDRRWSITELAQAMEGLPCEDPMDKLISSLSVLGPAAQVQFQQMIEARLLQENPA